MYSLDNTVKQLEEKIKEDDFVVADSCFFFPRIFMLDEESKGLIEHVESLERRKRKNITKIRDLENSLKDSLINKKELEKGILFLEEYGKVIDFLKGNEKIYITYNVKEELEEGISRIKKGEKRAKNRNFSNKEREYWPKNAKSERKKGIAFRKWESRKLRDSLAEMNRRIIDLSFNKEYPLISSYVPDGFSSTDKDIVAVTFYKGIVEQEKYKKCKILSFDFKHVYPLFKETYENLLDYSNKNDNELSKKIKSAKIELTSIKSDGKLTLEKAPFHLFNEQ